jgi:hypothetical protein
VWSREVPDTRIRVSDTLSTTLFSVCAPPPALSCDSSGKRFKFLERDGETHMQRKGDTRQPDTLPH